MKTVCVYCSSSEDLEKKYYIEAYKLGELLAANSFNLIHGGGIIGLMGHLLKAASKGGAKVKGVVPEKLNRPLIVNGFEQELIITDDMKFRKEYMRNNSDAFVALPGGFGTMEELLETITLKQLKYHKKPIVIINSSNYYDDLLRQIDKMFSEKFANPSYQSLYHVSESSEDAIEYIINYKYSEVFDKYLSEHYHPKLF